MNISPMVDVIFLLLLFFIVSSRLADESALRINLPESGQGGSVASVPLELNVTREGKIFHDGQEWPEDQLEARLASLQSQRGDDALTIRADSEARHGVVLRLYGMAQGAGFSRLNVAIRKE